MAGIIVGGISGLANPGTEPRWTGTNGFDDGVRNGLKFSTPEARDVAGTVSDALMLSLIAMPNIDAAVMWLAHDDADAAWQMTVINAQSLALTTAVSMAIKAGAGRARPYTRDCKAGDTECMGDDPAASFLSGHTALAFTGAGLVCAHHQNLPVYGKGIANDLACPAALTAATATGVMRMAADRHYATDVLAGAAIGLASGYILPNVLHYGFGADDDEEKKKKKRDHADDDPAAARMSVMPMASPSYLGLGISGVF